MLVISVFICFKYFFNIQTFNNNLIYKLLYIGKTHSGGNLEKPQLINFIAKTMEDSGFKVYKNFKTSHKIIDIYAVLPTTIGDFGVVVACNTYDKELQVGVDLLKEMEKVQESIKASKVLIVTSAYYTDQAKNYAIRKNIKLVDRDNLLEMANKYQMDTKQTTLDNSDEGEPVYIEEEYPDYTYDASDMEYIMQRRDAQPTFYKNTLYRQDVTAENQGSIFPHPSRPRGSFGQSSLDNYETQEYGTGQLVLMLFKNPLILIVFVVIFSYLIAIISGSMFKLTKGMVGLVEMVAALFLSYLLPLFTDRNADFIVKGTFIFFISLIILILLIFV